MKVPRRRFLRFAAGAVALPAASRYAWAQRYPARPVRLIVATAAGGPADIIARISAQWLSDRFGQPFVVENRTGGGGNIATEAVVRAPADGYTLLQIATAHMINAGLYDKLNFNFVRDIAPVVGIARVPGVMMVNPLVPVRNVAEFIAYAKAHPGKLNMGSSGIGGASHMAGELFKLLAGVDLVHVPYRGVSPALTDLLGGQLQMLFINPGPAIAYVNAGKLRALGITTATRSETLPDIPALSETVPGYEATLVYGLGVPRGTPAAIVNSLNQQINAGLAEAKIKERIADLDGVALAGSPAEFGRLIAAEIEKWGKVIRAASITPE